MREEGKINVNIDNDSQLVTLDVIGKVAFAFDFEQCESHAAKLLRDEDIVSDNISQILDSYNGTSEIMGQLFITPGPILKLQYAFRHWASARVEGKIRNFRISWNKTHY